MPDAAYLLEQAEQFRKDKLKIIREYADVSLRAAADRGTAVHAYIEDRLNGDAPNWALAVDTEATAWIAAVEKFMADCQPEVVLAEVVCFDRVNQIAGTCDAVLRLHHPTLGGLWELDYKSRTESSGHDRRTKEAAQLGAYYVMLTGKNGESYYIGDDGIRQTLTEPLRMGIVTFCPDGTWAMHEVDTDEAEKAYELALQMRHQSKVSTLYKGKATKSEPYDGNTVLMDAILNIPADAPELGALMRAWSDAGLPRASAGEVPPERFGEAMALIFRHAAKYQPFPEPKPAEPVCEADRWGRIAQRYFALPADLAEQVATQGAHLPSPSTPVVTVAEAQGWDRLIALAEEQADRRRREACELFRQLSALECPPVWQYLADDLTTWTESQVRLYRALWSCVDCGFLVPDVDVLVPDSKSCNELIEDEGGKRALVAKAKAKAKEYGITPVPSKWDDLIGSPLLYAAVIAA